MRGISADELERLNASPASAAIPDSAGPGGRRHKRVSPGLVPGYDQE